VLTVSALREDVEGVKNVTLSLPHLIGGEGDLGVLPIQLSIKEKMLLRESAEIIKEKIDEYEKR
jgi:L-lactate dehydrogenase